MTGSVGTLAICLALAMPASGATDSRAQEYTMADGDLGIPTTQWGGPKYAKGRLAVLVFLVEPVHEHECRRPMELQRAFDFDVAYVHITDHKRQVDNERARELLDRRRWDAIVFWHRWDWECSHTWLPDDVKFRVLAQVGDGAGLVITDRAPREILRDDRRVDPPVRAILGGLALTGRFARDGQHWRTRYKGKKPASEDAFRKDFFATFRIGKGRAVHYQAKHSFTDHTGNLKFARPVTWDHRVDPDYGLAELGRAILWAARREPDVEFATEPPSRLRVAPGKAVPGSVQWSFAVKGPDRDIGVRCRLRDLRGRTVRDETRRYRRASGELPHGFSLPKLGAGRYYLDVFVDGPRGRETFGYSTLEVLPAATVTLEGLPEAVEEGDTIRGAATVTGAITGDGKVEIRLVDSYDRVLARQVSPMAGRVGFTFPTDATCSLQMRVEADVVAGGLRVGGTGRTVNLLRRRQDRFTVVLWGAPGGAWAHYGRRMLRRTGVTHILARGGEDAGLGTVPFTMSWGFRGEVAGTKFDRFAAQVDPKTHVMSPCCWNDGSSADHYIGAAERFFAVGRRHPVLVYNMCDEGPTRGCCLHPACLAAYRAWLKEQYRGALAALNREWGSDYATWDGVTVMKPGDVREKQARETGRYARWSDRRHFASVNFARCIPGRQARLFRKHDPKLRVGFEGAGRFGLDFDAVIANTGFWCPYDGLQTELIRSLAPPGYIYSYWIGYQKDAASLIGHTWRMVFHGAPSLWWWKCKGRGRFHGWLAPNLAPYPENRRFINEVVLPLRQGLGDLLMRLDRPHDGIALYYSVAAANAGQLAESARFNSVLGAHASFIRLIEDCGFQWIYTTKPRVLAGDVTARGVRLLVLACHQALGDDEVAVLRKFVEAGGTVVADLRPGVFSGHLRPVGHSTADALFGVERTGKGQAVATEGRLAATLGSVSVPIVLRNSRSDGAIAPRTAEAAGTIGGAPIFLVNRIGRGRAILLNFHVTQYSGLREMGKGKEARDFLRALTAALGIRPRLERTSNAGELQRTETVTWTKGGVTLHGFLRDGGEAGAATVGLRARAHVFDLRRGGRGHIDRVTISELEPGRAELLAAYPYDPGMPTVICSAKNARRGETVAFRLSMTGVPEDETGPFSYRTELIGPKRQPAEWLPWCAFGPGGRTAVPVHFAHNDVPGRWTLRVRETTTGRTGEASVTLAP